MRPRIEDTDMVSGSTRMKPFARFLLVVFVLIVYFACLLYGLPWLFGYTR